ncbi:unnamed protein product [Cyprideis torosa]|uniref:NADPH-dependent FMN reductase-like domain-containing protein n=1 Tax=Cyprideis torosa TaxID=163714 RepID=A0A7R8WQ01_9CRUS|nr:unnamed protein product [Cyprideis torosa]CAG0907603.1 unnamed protein product [Cyprideis torosa]
MKFNRLPEDQRQALNLYVKLMRAANVATNKIHRHLNEDNLTMSQFGVIEALYHLGPLSQRLSYKTTSLTRGEPTMKTLHVLGICGSLRKHSTNFGLLRYAQSHVPSGMEIELIQLHEVPFYNADIQEPPAPVEKLKTSIERADALLLACPEYNYSLAPALKNALDWASRAPENHLLAGKPAAILGSGGGMGSARSQYHLRQVCVFLDLHPLNKPEVFSNAFDGSFDDEGNVVNPKIQKLIVEQLQALLSWANTLGS